MLHLVAYDISSRRLKRVARICEDFGVRVEKSVFECDLETETFNKFWQRLENTIDPDIDSIIDYPISRADERRIQSLGRVQRTTSGAWIF